MLPMSSRSVVAVSFSILISLIAFAVLVPFAAPRRISAAGATASGFTAAGVTVVSAASYGNTLAPDSVAAAFGERLATQTAIAGGDADPATPGIQLPTQLAGTTVEINGQRAGLFFVSANQINFVIPATTAPGVAIITVRASDGVISMGETQISAVAPTIFTANASGSGLPAAVLLRVAENGAQTFEPIAQPNPTTGAFTPIPITWKSANDLVFLVLYVSGTRGAVDENHDGNLNEAVRVSLGGQEVIPAFVGKSDFAGVEQLNVLIPRTLSGRGLIPLTVSYATQATSNVVSVEIGGASSIPVSVSSLSPQTPIYVGDEITINGSGFAPSHQVLVVEETEQQPFPAKVTPVSATQLKAIVPFGSGSGTVVVRTAQGDTVSPTKLTLRSSISGYVETTKNSPLPGATVKLQGGSITAVTDAEGKFILRDVPPGSARFVEIDTSTLPLPFPSLILKVRVFPNRDTHIEQISLTQVTGPSLAFTPPSFVASFAPDLGAVPAIAPTTRSIQVTGPTGVVKFEIDDNTTAIFPSGSPSGAIFLDIVENSRTPVKLPPRVFSSTIVQLTPFGVKLTPGGRLTFPNGDNLPANQPAKLYKLDQTPGSATLGEFVEAGTAQVSADGQTVSTAPNAITETSYYFIAIPRPVTTLAGRVVDSDGTTPVGEALVRARNQSVFTNSLGEFLLPDIAVSGPNDSITVEASYQRPGGRVDRAQPRTVTPVALNGLTRVAPDLILISPPNRPPTLIAPLSASVTEGQTVNLALVVSDPDANQTVAVTVNGPTFASIVQNQGNYSLRLAPGANTAALYFLELRAQDDLGAFVTRSITVSVNTNRQPVLTVPGPLTAQIGQNISFTVSATDPDLGQTLTFSATGLPTGADFNPATRQFSWTPSAGQTGSFTVSFRVTDNGLTSLSDTKTVTISVVIQWMQTNGPYGGRVSSLLVNEMNFFAGTYSGVFLSTNNGQSWTAVNNGLMGQGVNVLEMSGDSLFAGTGNGVFLSTNNGQSWTAVNNGMTNRAVLTLAVSGNNLFAGTSNGGVFQSTNSGQSWTAVNNGLTNQFVFTLEVSGGNLFAGTNGGGVFLSTNNGQSWTAVNNGLTINSVYTLKASGGNLFAGTNSGGVFQSTNNGQSWTAVNNGLTNQFVQALEVSGNNLFAGTGSDVFLSTNNGQNWMAVNNGLTGQIVYALAVSGNNILAGTDSDGVFLSTNNGQNWTTVNNELTGQDVRALGVNGSNLFAGTSGGVFLSPNNGQNWTAVNNGLTSKFVVAFAVSGNNLFAGTSNGGGVFLSTNNGQNWTAVNNGLTSRVVRALEVSGNNLFAGTRGGVFLSTNNGQNWTTVNNGLTSQEVRALAVSGSNLFAGTLGGVFLSTNNGQNWTAVNNGLTSQLVFTLAVSGSILFAGTSGGVFLSTNNGQNWTAVNNGLTSQDVRALAVSGNRLFAGTSNGSVFLSTNNGQSWTPVNNGLTNQVVNALAISGNRIFAGTGGSSVFVAQF